jgi:hypothetical protein
MSLLKHLFDKSSVWGFIFKYSLSISISIFSINQIYIGYINQIFYGVYYNLD